jgi:uncharacterized protein YyaL (SSP411 family)
MPTLGAFLVLAHASAVQPMPADLYERLSARVEAAYDSSRGGFVSKSRVPRDSAIELALLRGRREARHTVAPEGDQYPRLDARTARYPGRGYEVSPEWRQGNAALGKRADVNGRRLELLLAAGAATDEPGYGADARRVTDFLDRVLLDGLGGFVTAQIGDRDLEPASNGVAIHAWLTWATARLDRPARDFALRSIDRVWETCWDKTFGLIRRNNFGEITSERRLDDQVEMGRACVHAARLCGRPADRERAIALGDLLIARYEEKHAGFRTSALPKRDGSIQKAGKDSGENAQAARFLAELAP